MFNIYWKNVDGTKSLFYPLRDEMPFNTYFEAQNYVDEALIRLNVENRFIIFEVSK